MIYCEIYLEIYMSSTLVSTKCIWNLRFHLLKFWQTIEFQFFFLEKLSNKYYVSAINLEIL